MVLSYYIATQTVEEHLRFYSVLTFFQPWFSYFLEKQNATHSSSRLCLVERDSYFENVGHGPYCTKWLKPSTGLVFIYSGGEPHRSKGVRREVSGRQAEVSSWFTRGEMFQRALEWFVLTSRDSCVALHLGQCIRERWRDSGSSVHSVGRARVFFPISLVDVTSVCLPLTIILSAHSPSLQAAFSHAVVSGQRPDGQMDGKVKTSYFKQITPLCYQCFISKKTLLCNIKEFLKVFRTVTGNTCV